MDFNTAFAIVVGHEGVYSDDPNDRGNWTSGVVGKGELKGTKYGIAAHAYPHINIKALTLEDARRLYRKDRWEACRCDALPAGLRLIVFDCAVNQGVGAAANLLQEAAGVKIDGDIGPKTLAAAQKPGVAREFAALRAWRYEINRQEDEYGKGWFRRLFAIYDHCKELA